MNIVSSIGINCISGSGKLIVARIQYVLRLPGRVIPVFFGHFDDAEMGGAGPRPWEEGLRQPHRSKDEGWGRTASSAPSVILFNRHFELTKQRRRLVVKG